jgi:hypothetical protein
MDVYCCQSSLTVPTSKLALENIVTYCYYK